jgi:hypothetical protein
MDAFVQNESMLQEVDYKFGWHIKRFNCNKLNQNRF